MSQQIRQRNIHFVVGFSLGSIARDAADLDWQRVSANRWHDENDNLIIYLNDPRLLHGCRRGTRVYIFPGAERRDDFWELQDMMQMRECECEYFSDLV